MEHVSGIAFRAFAQLNQGLSNGEAQKQLNQFGRNALIGNVLRDGTTRAIPTEDMATGDIMLLSAVSFIPADGILIRAQRYSCNFIYSFEVYYERSC